MALGAVLERHLERAAPADLGLWTLRGLEVMEPLLKAELRVRHPAAQCRGPAARGPAAAAGGQPRRGRRRQPLALGLAALFEAAWQASPELRRAGAERMLRSGFEELFNHLDPYSRYLTPEEAQGARARRIGQVGLGLRLAAGPRRRRRAGRDHAGRAGGGSRAAAGRPGAGDRRPAHLGPRPRPGRRPAGRRRRDRGGAAPAKAPAGQAPGRRPPLRGPAAAQPARAGNGAWRSCATTSSGCSSRISPPPRTGTSSRPCAENFRPGPGRPAGRVGWCWTCAAIVAGCWARRWRSPAPSCRAASWPGPRGGIRMRTGSISPRRPTWRPGAPAGGAGGWPLRLRGGDRRRRPGRPWPGRRGRQRHHRQGADAGGHPAAERRRAAGHLVPRAGAARLADPGPRRAARALHQPRRRGRRRGLARLRQGIPPMACGAGPRKGGTRTRPGQRDRGAARHLPAGRGPPHRCRHGPAAAGRTGSYRAALPR